MNFSKKNNELRKTNRNVFKTIKIIVILLLFFITASTFSQQGINYKALVKDGAGNVVANQSITVQFAILQGVGMTNVYQETHSPTTDANGLIIVNIGEGAVNSGVYLDVDWGSDEHHLSVKINTGEGLVDLGTTQFMAVPYAHHASKITPGNLALNDLADGKTRGGGSSIHLGTDAGFNSAGYNNISLGFQSMYNNTSGHQNIGIGYWSLVSNTSGYYNTGLGNSSLSLNTEGYGNTATGFATMYSNITGSGNTANGFRTLYNNTGELNTATGYKSLHDNTTGSSNTAFGRSSLEKNIIGNRNTALGHLAGETSTGSFNLYLGNEAGRYNTDSYKLFIETSDANPNNALVYGEFGTDATTAGNILRTNSQFQIGNPAFTGYAFPMTDGTANLVLRTDGNGSLSWDTAIEPSGLEAVNEGNGIGWRLMGVDLANYGNIGFRAVDLSYSNEISTTLGATGNYSTALGNTTTASGFYSSAMGDGTEASGNGSTAMGSGTEASGTGSTAMGQQTIASGTSSVAMGNGSMATGNYSFAMGVQSTASGTYSSALGYDTTASRVASAAWGWLTEASGSISSAFGEGTQAQSELAFALGKNNIGGGSPTSWVGSDPLFEIGNGNPTRHNALTVLKNGNVGIDTATPVSKLHITNGSDVPPAGGAGYAVFGSPTGLNMSIDNNEIQVRNNGANDNLWLQIDGGNVLTGGTLYVNHGVPSGVGLRVNGSEAIWYNGTYFSWGFGGSANYFARNVGLGITNPNVRLDVSGSIEYTGTITDVSDERLKENFKPIEAALTDILKVKAYTYNMKDDEKRKREYGVIAQELRKIFPEMVTTVDPENDYLGVSYVQLVPVLIKALQEQQEIIEQQGSAIKGLSTELADIKYQNKSIEKRMYDLEKMIKFIEQ